MTTPIFRTSCINIVYLLAVLLVLTITSHQAAAQRSPAPIVDVHVHIMPDNNKNFTSSFEAALQLMDRYGVARSVIMSPPRPRLGPLGFNYKDFQNALSPHSDRFSFLAGGGLLNYVIHNGKKVTETVKREFVEKARQAIADGASGFGELSSLHISLSPKHGYSFAPANHPLLLQLADVAAGKNVPIDLHLDAVVSEMVTPPEFAQYPKNPPRFPATLGALERLLEHNRQARIVWAHGGSDQLGQMTPDRIGALMDRHPNLFMSLRVVGLRAPVQNKLFSGPPPEIEPAWMNLLERHSERFMIGVDGFYGGPIADLSQSTEPRMRATVRFLSLLPRGLARKIASENAIRIYSLPPINDKFYRSNIQPSGVPSVRGRLCRDGNLEHCRIMCDRGVRPACMRLNR